MNSDLDVAFRSPSCSSFEIIYDNFPWSLQDIVILCFGPLSKSCYSFDGKTNYISDSKFDHWRGGLTKYKNNLITVGGFLTRGDTELMERKKYGTFTRGYEF